MIPSHSTLKYQSINNSVKKKKDKGNRELELAAWDDAFGKGVTISKEGKCQRN